MVWEMNNSPGTQTAGEGQAPNRFTRRTQRSGAWKQNQNYRSHAATNSYTHYQGNWWKGYGGKWKNWKNWDTSTTQEHTTAAAQLLKEALKKMMNEHSANNPPSASVSDLPIPSYLAQKISQSTPAPGEGGHATSAQASIPSMLAIMMEEEQKKLDETNRNAADKARISELKYLLAIPLGNLQSRKKQRMHGRNSSSSWNPLPSATRRQLC